GMPMASRRSWRTGDFALARLSSKSDSVEDQLRRIPANDVVRIELVDGNTLDIPGLTGLVANVIYTSTGVSGQFRWNTGFRSYNTQAQLYGGEASLSGKSGALDYTVALSNTNDRFGADGPVIITDGSGALIEEQYSKFSGKYDNPKLATTFAYDFGGGIQANLNLSYGEDYFIRDDPEIGYPVIGPVRTRSVKSREVGPEYEIGGDIQFPLGPGSLKLIGLERFDKKNYTQTLIDRFDDASPATGSRYRQLSKSGERIGRLEYSWKMLNADWQISGEAAFNRLDQNASLFRLSAGDDFVQIPFPGGVGGVRERRYDTSLSYSRSLSPRLSIQAIAAMEFSTIEQTGALPNSRSFKRPKGSFAATWKPSTDFDVSLTLARRVSQLSFGDFLASVSLNSDNESGGNNELVPYQSWNVELEANKTLGPWGSIKLLAKQAWFEDFIDWFPLPNGGEARGNIGDADRLHLEATATLKLDPIGWTGARLDINAIKRFMNVTDPFTGIERSFSYDQEGGFDIDLRHDIPKTDWAYGAGLSHFDQAGYARRYEEGREWEGPVFDSFFIENKDVLGLTVRLQAVNVLLGGRNYYRRTVFEETRPSDQIAFMEYSDRRIGPIFRLRISGDF
ncbi:hypothetical protein, partial [Qipengyuania sp.]|uniref:hypothetical protein n=1 Tax=Qipengyuania sp. TaxID=2004515 RepID=UPI0035C7DDA2